MIYEPEDCFLPPLLRIDVNDTYYEKPYPRRGYNHDIYARDIYVIAEEGLGMPPVEIYGISKEHTSWNIYLENFFFNGKRITDAKGLNLKVNEFTGPVYLDGKQIN